MYVRVCMLWQLDRHFQVSFDHPTLSASQRGNLEVNERNDLFELTGVKSMNGYTMMSVPMLHFAICV